MNLSSLMLFLQMLLSPADAKGQCGVTISCTGGSIVSGKVAAELDNDQVIANTTISIPTISSVKWYRNGMLVQDQDPNIHVGAFGYTVDEMGYYKVVISSACGTSIDQVKVTLKPLAVDTVTYANGYHFSGATLSKISGSNFPDYLFGGDIYIDPGTTLNLTLGTGGFLRILCKPCTRIIVQKGNGTDGGQITANGVEFLGLEEWQGIVVEGEPTESQWPTSTNNPHGLLSSTNGLTIMDAHIGIDVIGGGRVVVPQVIFRNNHVGLAIRDYSFNHNISLHHLNFYGSYINNPDSCDGVAHRYKGFYQPQLRKMIYLDGVNGVKVRASTMYGNLFSNGGNAGIVSNSCQDIEIDSCLFFTEMTHALSVQGSNNLVCDSFLVQGSFAEAMKVDNSVNCRIGSMNMIPFSTTAIVNTFDGDMSTPIKATNSPGLKVYSTYFGRNTGITNNIVNSAEFDNCEALNLWGCDFNSMINAAVKVSNSNKVKVGSCFFNNPNTGLLLENNEIITVGNSKFVAPSIGINATGNRNLSIDTCEFIYTNNPRTATGMLLNQTDTLTLASNVLKGCQYAIQAYTIKTNNLGAMEYNVLDSNIYALVLSPEENPVTAAVNANTNNTYQNTSIACNLFKQNEYALLGSGNIIDQGNTSVTTGNKFVNNVEWDLLWQDYSTPYFKFSINRANIFSYPNGNISVLNFTNIDLNGSANPISLVFMDSIINPDCFQGLRIGKGLSCLPIPSELVRYSNPFGERFSIFSLIDNIDYLDFINLLGQSYEVPKLDTLNSLIIYDSSGIPPGIYFVQIGGRYIKVLKN